MPRSGIDADIQRLDVAIRQLKIQYDMFYAGAVPTQPVELRAEVERIIKRHSVTPIHKYAQRFHFNALVSRYNSLSELWTKTTRAMEQGERRMPVPGERLALRERLLARCRVRDPSSDQETLRRLHSRFLSARSRYQNQDSGPSFESFLNGIAAQTRRLREQANCAEIELRLVVRDDRVQLKARPGR